MKSFRPLLLLPSAACGIISIILLTQGNYLYFSLWLFATVVFFLMFWPLIGDVTVENTPVIQVFGALLLFFFLITLVAIIDLRVMAGLSYIEAIGYGTVIGFVGIALLMIIKGN